MIAIDIISRHHINGRIFQKNIPNILFTCYDLSGNNIHVTKEEVDWFDRDSVKHFSYRHGLISPLHFSHLTGVDGQLLKLPNKNFFLNTQVILKEIFSDNMQVAELGALTQPLFRKESHYVTYVDYKNTSDLKKSNSRLVSMKNEVFADIDVITSDFFSKRSLNFDLIYSAHVLEHPPSLFQFINKMLSRLKLGGYIVSAVPEKSHTFDAKRRTTSFSESLGWFVANEDKPQPTQVVDFCLHQYSEINFSMLLDDDYFSAILHAYNVATQSKSVYTDCHACVYSAETFLNHLLAFIRLGLLKLKLSAFYYEPNSPDFTFILQKSSEPSQTLFKQSLKIAEDYLHQREI